MLLPPLLLLSILANICMARNLAQRVEQSLENRATYQGGWALHTQSSCPQNYSTACGDATQLNQVCCPTGNKCFGSSGVAYCCPGTQDCSQITQTFPVCADPNANMYAWGGTNFCCEQGSIGIYPVLGYPFCQAGDSSVPSSLLATMVSQYGGTSVTPFGGYGTTAVAAPSRTGPAGTQATPTSGSSPPANSPTSSSGSTTSSPANINLSNSVITGIAVGAVFVIIVLYMTYKCCSNRNWRPWKSKTSAYSYAPGPSYMPASSASLYAPSPMYSQSMYDPVLERRLGVGVSPMSSRPRSATPRSPAPRSPAPMSPTPRTPIPDTPCPEYRIVDAHEMDSRERRDDYRPAEVHAVPVTGDRLELPGN